MNNQLIGRTSRRIDLEALRGLAACIVFFHHFMLSFMPKWTGFMATNRDEQSLIGSPFFGLINGQAAVYFFFVLSGYVLTIHFLRTGQIQVLRSMFLKRLPRLAFPVMISCLLFYVLLKFNWIFCGAASESIGSSWLKNVGFGHDLQNFEPNLVRAMLESVAVFFTGANKYNSSLWSMQPEMTGSILVMAFAVLLKLVLRMEYGIYSSLILLIVVAKLDPMLCSFMLGLFIAYIHVRYPLFRLHRIASWGMFVFGLYLMGYAGMGESYRWLSHVQFPPFQAYELGGFAILASVIFCDMNFTWLTGSLGAYLGGVSFPLYLLHVAIISSLSSFIYLQGITHWGEWQLFTLNLFCTSAVLLGASSLLKRIDDWWIDFLNSQFRTNN